MRQNERWYTVAMELNRSLYGEQMVCSMSTQLFHIPETKDLKGNVEMHKHLVPASYHRVTAAGSAQRLLAGERAVSILKTLYACIQSAEQEDRHVKAGLQVMKDAAPTAYKPFIETIIRWQDYAENHLRVAKQMTGPALWNGQSPYDASQVFHRFSDASPSHLPERPLD